MDLLLWRHADAEPHGAVTDLERALTPKGEKQAAQMAAWLDERLDGPVRVLASPARRCQQTAKALGRPIETVDTIAPDVPPGNVLAAAGWPSAEETVLVCGHQPTLGLAAALVLGGRADGWSMKKGSVWWFRREAGEVELLAVQVPSLL